jgi:hypothetical protein
VNASEIVSSIIGAVAVALLSFILSTLRRLFNKFDRFMAEHMWLIATTLWTRDKVMEMMQSLGMPMTSDPPANMEEGKHHE